MGLVPGAARWRPIRWSATTKRSSRKGSQPRDPEQTSTRGRGELDGEAALPSQALRQSVGDELSVGVP